MQPRGSSPWRTTAVVVGVASFAAFVLWLTLRIAGGDVDTNDKLASVISMYVAVVGFPVAMIALVVTARQGRRAGPAAEVNGGLDAIADMLALSVRGQWEDEERIRRVHDPFPLPVRWSNADEQLVDHWQNIHGSTEPIPLDGCGDEIADVFDRVPSRRLVVLGEAGAGKTILTSRFVLTQLSRRRSAADGPVPMIFSLGSWDPTSGSLRSWLVGRLLADYPALAATDATGATTAALLLTTGRVMPVLDGFDEIPERLRGSAITEINAALNRTDRLLLTSRPEEYASAVESGDVLTAAAVVELADLDFADLAHYLPLTTRKAGASTKWHAVLRRMRDRTDGVAADALAATLSNPLMVALARSSFSDTRADPQELLELLPPHAEVSVAEYQQEIENHLFAGFVPAVYSDAPNIGKIERWLRFLAHHVDEVGGYDLAWWRLVSAVPRKVRGVVAGLAIALPASGVVAAMALLGDWKPEVRALWWMCGLGFGTASGVIAAVMIGLGYGSRLPPAPSRMRMRVSCSTDQVITSVAGGLWGWRSVVWVALFLFGGLLFGLTGQLFLGLDDGVFVGVTGGFVIGLAVRFVIGLVRTLRVPVDPLETISPGDVLRVDRRAALWQGILVGLGSAVVLVLGFLVTIGAMYGLVSGTRGWLGLAVASLLASVVIWIFFFTVWGPWLLARVWLPLRGRLPWHVMAFLADAHRRGVLRQAGGVYQFRHARLQDHLVGGQARGASAAGRKLHAPG